MTTPDLCKKFLCTAVLVLFGTLTLQAAPVSPTRAKEIAKKIFAAQPATKAGAGEVTIIWDGEDVATKAAQPAFYVITRDGGGFVIIAGDDNVPPVLAISENGRFSTEGMPDNVKWWMERMKAGVRAAGKQSPEVRALWARYADTKAGAAVTGPVTVISEHLTPEWDQLGTWSGRPVYNSKCPKVGERYTLTGCAATAVSEVMTILSGIYPTQMPTHGEGTVPPYEVVEGFDASASTPEHPYELGTTYDWEGLRSLTGWEAIKKALQEGREDLVDNMDQLLADVGAALQSQYSVEGTGVSPGMIVGAMIRHFGFNKNAYLVNASDYTPHRWREKLKGELDVRPVLYNGYTEDGTGGHSFVFDAYGQFEGEDVFHINFGWSGFCNGYYYEGNYDSDGDPNYNFSWECCACFDLYPDASSTYRRNIKLVPVDSNTPFGFSYTGSAPAAKGDLLLLDWFRVSNRGNDTFDGKLRVVALNREGDVLQVFGQLDRKDSPLNSRSSFRWCFNEEDDIHILFDMSLGDRIVLQYTTDDENTVWQQAEGSVTAERFIDELPLMPAAFIRTKASYQLNDWFDLALMNHDKIYAGTEWTFTDPDGNAVTIRQSDDEFQLTKKGRWKIEAAVAPAVGDPVTETLVTYIKVQ